MAKRLTIVLSDEAAALLVRLAGSPRKQSEVLEGLVRAAALTPPPASPVPSADLVAVRRDMLRLANELAVLTARLVELENQAMPSG